jgi:hypothetical protein
LVCPSHVRPDGGEELEFHASCWAANATLGKRGSTVRR